MHFDDVSHQLAHYGWRKKLQLMHGASVSIASSLQPTEKEEPFNSNPINSKRIHHLTAGFAIDQKHVVYCCQGRASVAEGQHNKTRTIHCKITTHIYCSNTSL